MIVKYANIYEYITGKENEYEQPISINGWEWGMKDQIQKSFFYKHGRLLEGNDADTVVKNITKPLLNLQYRAEDIDVKDIVLYVDDPDSYHLSFLVKKYHDDVFVVENDLDTFIDKVNESKVDYGLGLVKQMKEPKPEVIDLQSIAFCDQTDILKGPIGIKHFFNPAELKDMGAKGWGKPENGATITIDALIALSEEFRDEAGSDERQVNTPGAYIEIYEVHGVLPRHFLDDSDSEDFIGQFQIVGFYRSKTSNDKFGVTLFKKEEKKNPFKQIARDEIFSRALGFGGAEEIAEPQVWTNYAVQRQKDLLDAASKVVLKGIGTDFKSKFPGGLKDVDNLQILELNEGEDLAQVDTTPRSMQLFDNFESGMMENAQLLASAEDPVLGRQPPSGSTFRGQERVVIEGKGIHEYRRGKFAKFLEDVYRDWIIPHIIAKITQGTKFLSELSTEEMQFVADQLMENEANKFVKEKILNGEDVFPEEVELFREKVRADFVKGGNKRFIEILKGEFKNKVIRIKITISGKQKDLQFATDVAVNLWNQMVSNPEGFQQVMAIPGASNLFNSILEFSDLSPVHFSGLTNPQQPTPSPVQPLLEAKTAPQPQNV